MAALNGTALANNSSAVKQSPLHVYVSWFSATTSISVFGSILVIVLLVAIVKQPQLRRGSGILITHLLAIELCMIAVFYPITNTITFIVQYYRDPARVQSIDCALVQFFMTTFQHAGNWSSFFLAVNRYVAVLIPHSHKRFSSKYVIFGMITSSWTISLCCNLPLYFGIGGEIGRTASGDCGLLRTSKTDYPFRAAFAYYIPLISLVAIYFTLFVRTIFLRRYRVSAVIPTKTQLERAKRRLSVTKMLFASSLFYVICYFPAPVLVTFFPQYGVKNRDAFFYIRMLVVCGYACNPLICFLMNEDYRKAALHVFCQRPVFGRPPSGSVNMADSAGNHGTSPVRTRTLSTSKRSRSPKRFTTTFLKLTSVGEKKAFS